jgi:hypothetical protein
MTYSAFENKSHNGSWTLVVGEIHRKLSNHEMLLSDALIETMMALGSRVPEPISKWLNREVTGYDAADIKYFENLNFNREISNRIVQGKWIARQGVDAAHLTKVPQNGSASFLHAGIQDIEVYLAEDLDLKVLSSGDEGKISEMIARSGFREKTFFLSDQRFPGFLLKFKGEVLIKLYREVWVSLVRFLAITPAALTGVSLLIA